MGEGKCGGYRIINGASCQHSMLELVIMPYPLGIESKIITGQYADLYYDRTDGQYKSRPTTGFVYVYPAVTEIRVGDTVVDLSEVNPQRIAIDEFGQFEFEAIVTDQDGIVPNNGWTYRFVPSWNEKTVNIPILETSPSTIDITDYFDAEFVPGVIITKGDPGRGIDNITSAGNIATVHFDDGTTDTFELPIGDGSGGDTPDATTSIKGKVKLAGDFAGTADVPLIGTDRIDSSKLAPAVRTSLGKADTAVQPAGLTKAAVGLGNVDNTSDVNKPVSNATQSALNLKVNISSLHTVATTGSYNDLTSKPTIPDSKDDIGLGNVDNTSDANKPISTATQAALDLKSNVGHTHSQYVTSVNGETPDINGAVEVVTDWADITSKPSTFTPSTHTHAIADVTGLQTALDSKAAASALSTKADLVGGKIPTSQMPNESLIRAEFVTDVAEMLALTTADVQNGDIARIIGEPTSYMLVDDTAINNLNSWVLMPGVSEGGGSETVLTVNGQVGDVVLGKADIGLANVDNTSDANKPISTATQTALDGKANATHTHSVADLDDASATITDFLDSVNAAEARTAIGAGTSNLALGTTGTTAKAGNYVPDWSEITSIPSTFTPSAHSHAIADVTNLQTSLDGKEPTITAGTTSEFWRGDKTFVAITKSTVGLGNVDNTSDATKFSNTALTGTPTAPTAAPGTNTTQIATTAFVTDGLSGKANSSHTHTIANVTGLQGELDLKAPLESPAFTGTVTGITKGMVGLGSVDNTSDANKPISTATQTALDGKANTSHTHLWADITDKPTTFAPSAHTHVIADVTNLQTSLDAKASLTGTETLTNKTVNDNTFFIQDETDNTKKVQFQVSGVTTGTTRTITIPNFTGTMYVTGGTDVSVADGGTGRSTSTTAYGIIAAGTTATGAHQTIAPGTSGHFLKSAGASALGSFAAIVAADLSDSTATGRSVLTATDAAAARTAIGAGTSNLALGTTSTTAKAGDYVPAWTEITGKPSTFTPSAHTHDIADINATGTPSGTTYLRGDGTWSTPAGGGAVDSVNSQTGAVVLDTDDISDSGATNKYVTAAEKTKLSNLSGTNTGDQTITLTGEVTGSGTGSFATTVTNSAVIGKVITGYTSGAGTVAATDTILQAIQKLNGNDALKAPLASPTFTGTVSGITKAMVGLGNVDNTSDANKPVSTATQSALDGKQPLDSDLTAIAAIAPSNDDFIQRKSGAWTNRTVAQVKTDLGLTGINSGDQTITLTGEVTGSGTGSFAATVTNSAVIGKVLTGYTSGAGTVAATDTILQAIQKLNGNIALKADSTHTHGISDVTSLQTTLDTKATKANGVLGTGLPWSKELMVNGSAALAAGFNDVPGGVMADREIVLESMVFRIADPTATIGGSGNLTITWSYGSMTTTTPTTITTTNIAAGQHDIWVVLETPLTIAINNCLRASFTMGTATVSTPCHIEWRGRYA